MSSDDSESRPRRGAKDFAARIQVGRCRRLLVAELIESVQDVRQEDRPR